MSAEDTPPPPPPDDSPGEQLDYGLGDKALAGVLLLGALGLAYICLDVMSGGRITQALSKGPR